MEASQVEEEVGGERVNSSVNVDQTRNRDSGSNVVFWADA